MRWKNVKGKAMSTAARLIWHDLERNRAISVAAIRGIADCLAHARLDPHTVSGLKRARDYEEARLRVLDEQIMLGA